MASQEAMTGPEACRLARIALRDRHPMELAVVAGVARMIPSGRHTSGIAKNATDQEACDAYNWLVDHWAETLK